MLPDLPAVNYKVWVRGYGILDSKPIDSKPTTASVALKVETAKTPADAAKVYPGDYWLSMLAPPPASAFPRTEQASNRMIDQDHWIDQLKKGCNFCHQLGSPLSRDIQHVFVAKPDLPKTHADAWEWRLGVGVRGTNMYGTMTQMGKDITVKALADWTESIEKGALPPVPARPSGIERNVVSTQWDIGDDHSFMHDQISTSKQNPKLNGGGNLYAVSAGHGTLVVLNPKTNQTNEIEIPTRDERSTIGSRFPPPNPPSLWWGDAHLWNGPTYDPSDPHNPMMDDKGRVWLTSKIRTRAPAWCADPTLNKSAAYYPLSGGGRQASYYDPKTQKFQLIETCYSTHHLQFDNDADSTVYFNELSGPIFGWIDSKVYDQTLAATKDEVKAEQAAVGWCPQAIDTNGDGKITKPWQVAPRNGFDNQLYVTDTAGGGGGTAAAAARGAAAPAPPAATAPAAPAAGAPAAGAPAGRGAGGAGGGGGRGRGGAAAPAAPVAFNPQLDTLLANGGYSLYSLIPSPADDSVWGVAETFPGYLIRLRRGNNPPESCLTQIFKVPSPGLDPRGVDIDSNGVVWTALAASSHLASFDVRKCKNLNGTAEEKLAGTLCPEGWSLYQTTGPKFQGTNIPTEFHYFNWTDQFGASGFPPNTPMATGSNSDSILVLTSQQGAGTWVTMRVPFPLGFYARGLDARVDDPNAPAGFAGWKNRAVWSNYGTHFVWHIEGGKGTKGKEVKFQVRPDPLAR
jgi:hypothetical protein